MATDMINALTERATAAVSRLRIDGSTGAAPVWTALGEDATTLGKCAGSVLVLQDGTLATIPLTPPLHHVTDVAKLQVPVKQGTAASHKRGIDWMNTNVKEVYVGILQDAEKGKHGANSELSVEGTAVRLEAAFKDSTGGLALLTVVQAGERNDKPAREALKLVPGAEAFKRPWAAGPKPIERRLGQDVPNLEDLEQLAVLPTALRPPSQPTLDATGRAMFEMLGVEPNPSARQLAGLIQGMCGSVGVLDDLTVLVGLASCSEATLAALTDGDRELAALGRELLGATAAIVLQASHDELRQVAAALQSLRDKALSAGTHQAGDSLARVLRARPVQSPLLGASELRRPLRRRGLRPAGERR